MSLVHLVSDSISCLSIRGRMCLYDDEDVGERRTMGR